MREKILNMLEKNSRIDLKDMAVMLGMTEVEVANVLSTSTHFVLKKYKDYGRVLDAEEKDERMLVTP